MSPTPNQTDVFGSDVQSNDAYPDCVNCGASPYNAPEGLKPDGSPQWDFPSCYKCGHITGADVSDVRKAEREFEEFKAWQAQRYQEGNQRGLQPPETAEEAAAASDAARSISDDLAGRNAPAFTPPEQPFTPGGSR